VEILPDEYLAYCVALSNIPTFRRELNEKIKRQMAKGIVSKSWEYQKATLDDFEILLSQLIAENSHIGENNEQLKYITKRAITICQKEEPINDKGSFGAHINREAVRALVIAIKGPSETSDLLSKIPKQYEAEVNTFLMNTIIFGDNPRPVASKIHKMTGIDKEFCEILTSTAVLCAYRNATIEIMHANASGKNGWIESNGMIDNFRQSNVAKAWMWAASLNQRACPRCLAMNGSIHSLSEDFITHPGCRCDPLPIADFTTSPRISPNSGWQWFDLQSEDVKLLMVSEEMLLKINALKSSGDENPLRTLYVEKK
jgi:hypothetical protein